MTRYKVTISSDEFRDTTDVMAKHQRDAVIAVMTSQIAPRYGFDLQKKTRTYWQGKGRVKQVASLSEAQANEIRKTGYVGEVTNYRDNTTYYFVLDASIKDQNTLFYTFAAAAASGVDSAFYQEPPIQ